MRRLLVLSGALFALPAMVLATSARATEFSGNVSFRFWTLPPLVAAGSASGTSTVGPNLITLPSQPFVATGPVHITLSPTAAAPLTAQSIALTAPVDCSFTGTPIGGPCALGGTWNALIGGAPFLIVPLSGMGQAGRLAFGPYASYIDHQSWIAATATPTLNGSPVTTGNTFSPGALVQSFGYDDRTAAGGGNVKLVAPAVLNSSLGGILPLFAHMTLDFGPMPPPPVTLEPGDSLVMTDPGGLILVDPVSGVQTSLRSFVDPGRGLALDAAGEVLVSRESVEPPDVLRIDPVTNAETTVTTGGNLGVPRALESEAPAAGEERGPILVADAGAGELFRVDPETGAQSALAQGGFASGPVGVALEADGSILVADGSDLVRVNPSTGSKAVVCGGVLSSPRALAVGPGGEVFVIDGSAVLGWDPVSCGQTLSASGGQLVEPRDLGVEADGNLLVVDAGGGGDAKLIRVNSGSGAQAIVASAGNLAGPMGLVVMPPSVMVVHPADDPVQVEMLGGVGEPGGLEVTLDATEGGSVTADYDPLTQQELNEKVTSGESAPLDFAVPGDTTQFWEIDFGGVFEELVTLVFCYDEAVLGPFSEDWLSVYHFLDGAWQRLTGVVDTVANTITVEVASLSPFVLGAFPECSDQIDNDGDGDIDGNDAGCRNDEDPSEEFDCSDGINNDADGLVDGEDPGCANDLDASEKDDTGTYPCDDGVDNDGDGFTDYLPDLGCLSADAGAEDPECDLDGDEVVDRTDVDEIFAASQTPAINASDPRDQDGDGMITVLDGRRCTLKCTYLNCNPAPPAQPPGGCGLAGPELLALFAGLEWLRRRRRGPAEHAQGRRSS